MKGDIGKLYHWRDFGDVSDEARRGWYFELVRKTMRNKGGTQKKVMRICFCGQFEWTKDTKRQRHNQETIEDDTELEMIRSCWNSMIRNMPRVVPWL